jgi:hypothetical protein
MRPQTITKSMTMTREMLNLTERREGMRSGGIETRILGMLSMSVVAERMRMIVWIWKAGSGISGGRGDVYRGRVQQLRSGY